MSWQHASLEELHGGMSIQGLVDDIVKSLYLSPADDRSPRTQAGDLDKIKPQGLSRDLPGDVKSHMGYALYVAQQGGKHRDAKPLKGFGGARVVEIVKDYRGDTFRAVYTVRLAGAVYILHVFQKKSK